MKRYASLVLVFALIASLVGCLPTYVGDPETAKVDPAFVGIWHMNKDSRNEFWTVHQMNDHNYLVQAYMLQPGTDGKPAIDSTITSRAWLADIGGAKFVSMEMYTPGQLMEPKNIESKNRYIVARITLDGDALTVQGVNPDFLKGDALASTPAALEEIIKKSIDKDDLYIDKAVYKKIDIKNPGGLKDMLTLIK